MQQRGVGLGWESGQCLLILAWPFSENKRAESSSPATASLSSSPSSSSSSTRVAPLVAMKIYRSGVVGNTSGVGGGTTLLSECCAGLTELCLAFCGKSCHANFLQPFQTGLDSHVFDPILEATWDAVIEP